jgi:hypothetical protein
MRPSACNSYLAKKRYLKTIEGTQRAPKIVTGSPLANQKGTQGTCSVTFRGQRWPRASLAFTCSASLHRRRQLALHGAMRQNQLSYLASTAHDLLSPFNMHLRRTSSERQ